MDSPAIAAEGLTKRFGSVVALDGLDLEVAQGTVFGLLGPNGAGKTTAVRILTTILPPDGGTATVLGIDVARRPSAVRRRIGLAGQYAAVDANLTGRENLRLMGRLTHLPKALGQKRADELLERFGLSAAADRPAKTYSGGMRRRLDLAAALVHRPPVLFLDEPSTGLDPASRVQLWAVIGELVAEGTTVLLTTQYLEEADRLAHRIMVVDDGRSLAEGTAAELKAGMGTTSIEVGLAGEDEAARAQTAMSALGDVEASREATTVRLGADGPGALVGVLGALEREGLVPLSIAYREPTLDDVFLTLTGHRVESGSEGDGSRVNAVVLS
ncbi:MAG: ATP-binding cassette domain-containing protein [Acidimicrobiales bacterium]